MNLVVGATCPECSTHMLPEEFRSHVKDAHHYTDAEIECMDAVIGVPPSGVVDPEKKHLLMQTYRAIKDRQDDDARIASIIMRTCGVPRRYGV